MFNHVGTLFRVFNGKIKSVAYHIDVDVEEYISEDIKKEWGITE